MVDGTMGQLLLILTSFASNGNEFQNPKSNWILAWFATQIVLSAFLLAISSNTFVFYLQINNDKSTGYFMLIALMHSVMFGFDGDTKNERKMSNNEEKITFIYSTFYVECVLRASCIGNDSHYHFRSILNKIFQLNWRWQCRQYNRPNKGGKTAFTTWNSFYQPKNDRLHQILVAFFSRLLSNPILCDVGGFLFQAESNLILTIFIGVWNIQIIIIHEKSERMKSSYKTTTGALFNCKIQKQYSVFTIIF